MSEENTNPSLIAITMGDPAGIGPEIIAKAWSQMALDDEHRFVVVGCGNCLRRAIRQLGLDLDVSDVDSPEHAREVNSTAIPCYSTGPAQAADVVPGEIDAVAGRAAFEYLSAAIEATRAGQTDAIVTCPIHKTAMLQAGYNMPGHTEILAERCGVSDFAMMLYIPAGQQVGAEIGLGVVHTTLHQSLRSALDELSASGILSKIKLAHEFASASLQQLGMVRRPRIAVAALNPHAGEAGHFGKEEIEIIAPAVELARNLDIDCRGPLPCDTLMGRAVAGEFDMVVAMYHDQGHIALKLLGMHKAVNVTLGLPIIRTSVAHGTAFEIAGTGNADCTSLLRAIDVAKRLVDQAAVRCSNQ
ncbi:MAG: 4-hydroxythreonine-4-phosphate dehydrogenase PdxA [Pirellulaceae bacterium]